MQDRWECVVCGVTGGVHQAFAFGAEVSVWHVKQGLERETVPYALSPLRVSVFREAFNLSSNVAPFFCVQCKG